MKRFSNFKLNASHARRIAEAMWGRGGTNSFKTNRRGTWFISCAGHGGYIVDPSQLSETEKAAIQRHRKPYSVAHIIVVEQDDIIRKTLTDLSTRSASFHYNPTGGPVNQRWIPVWVFEEDVDWAYLEYHAGVRAEGVSPQSEAQLEKAVEAGDHLKEKLAKELS